MSRYCITYKDSDPGCPEFTWYCYARDEEHAVDKFQDDGDDWVILKVTRGAAPRS